MKIEITTSVKAVAVVNSILSAGIYSLRKHGCLYILPCVQNLAGIPNCHPLDGCRLKWIRSGNIQD